MTIVEPRMNANAKILLAFIRVHSRFKFSMKSFL